MVLDVAESLAMLELLQAVLVMVEVTNFFLLVEVFHVAHLSFQAKAKPAC